MGADLILTYTPLPYYDDGHFPQFWVYDRKTRDMVLTPVGEQMMTGAQERIAALSTERLLWLHEEDLTLEADEEPNEEALVAVLRKQLLSDLEEVCGAHFSRETTTRLIRGRPYLFTGGMSWGDTPTEAYDPVSRLGYMEVLDFSIGSIQDFCVVHLVGNGDTEHDCAEHQVVGYHEADGVPTSELCPGLAECADCQDVRTQHQEEEG